MQACHPYSPAPPSEGSHSPPRPSHWPRRKPRQLSWGPMARAAAHWDTASAHAGTRQQQDKNYNGTRGPRLMRASLWRLCERLIAAARLTLTDTARYRDWNGKPSHGHPRDNWPESTDPSQEANCEREALGQRETARPRPSPRASSTRKHGLEAQPPARSHGTDSGTSPTRPPWTTRQGHADA